DLGLFRDMVERYERERNVPAVEIAAALAKLVQGDNPLLLTPPPAVPRYAREERDSPREHRGQATRKFVERDNASNSGAHRQE
ncbi:ATP-dependent RNA helicase, partial [Lysobacter sp. 2RAB21]